MGVHFIDPDADRWLRMLSDQDGVTEGFILEELLRRELERRGTIPTRDEGTRRAMQLVDQIRDAIPFEEQKERFALARRLRAELRDVQDELATLPRLDPRPADVVMRELYNKDGLPR